jgi:uncharacterized protein (TIGR03083 family)
VATRALRQYYEPVTVVVPDEVVALDAWIRHRRRFAEQVRGLREPDWRATTRCTSWDTKAVLAHLVTVDAFWVFTLSAARARNEPTTYLRAFDPSTGTDTQVAELDARDDAYVLERFTTGADALIALAQSFTAADWEQIGESPLGHLPARLLFAHAFWDSWLHERDILVPLGRGAPPEPDELLAVTCFSLCFAGLQGGLVGDAAATGPTPPEPIDVVLGFDDLPGTAVRVELDRDVRITLADPAGAVPSGSAVTLVEGVAGRCPATEIDAALPRGIAEQVVRASQVL